MIPKGVFLLLLLLHCMTNPNETNEARKKESPDLHASASTGLTTLAVAPPPAVEMASAPTALTPPPLLPGLNPRPLPVVAASLHCFQKALKEGRFSAALLSSACCPGAWDMVCGSIGRMCSTRDLGVMGIIICVWSCACVWCFFTCGCRVRSDYKTRSGYNRLRLC